MAIALTGVLAWAAFTDIRKRIIPNAAVLSVVVLYLAWAVARGGEGVVSALLASLSVFVAATVLFAVRAIGAGDAKLFASIALFAGTALLFPFLVATTLAGGLIAVLSLAKNPERAFAMMASHFHKDSGLRVPYGVALAIAGILLIWSQTLGLPVAETLRERMLQG